MWTAVADRALLAQRQTLVHTEAVLLVHDDKTEIGKRDVLLKQRVRADRDRNLSRTDGLEHGCPRAPVEAPGESGHGNAQGFEPGCEIAQMLLSQQLGWRHHRDLEPGLDRGQRRRRRDHGLAAADIALHQPLHRMSFLQVGKYFLQHPALGTRERKRQLLEQLLHQRAPSADQWCLIGLHLRAPTQQAQVECQQLLERQSLLRRVLSAFKRNHVHARRRAVYQQHRLLQRRQLQLRQDFGRQPFRDFVEITLERGERELAQRHLMHAFGGWVYRRERSFRLRGLAFGKHGVFRVRHFETGRAETHFTKTAQASAAREVVALRGVEIKKPQMDVAGTVGEPHHQAATPTINNVGEFDFAGDHRLHARAQPPDGRDARTVLIAMRQVEQHVLDRREPQARVFPGPSVRRP